jgi:1,4-dihydroxy-2-naphthoate polyprenyltransferase
MANRWVLGARLRTLPAAVVPVAVGCGVAGGDGAFRPGRAVLALVAALGLQVGTNYANDYSDGVRGTDAKRVGPPRLVGSGLAAPAAVRTAAMLAFGVAAVAGAWLAALTTVWLLPIGAACVAAGWLYTGGPRPYGYIGLGEVFVFVFFGLVATAGTAYVQEERLTWLMVQAGIPVGLLAVALLVTNNLRDIPGDTASGKRTLAVRLGDPGTRALYVAVVVAAFAAVIGPLAQGRLATAWTVLALPFAIEPVRTVISGATGPALIPVLQATSRLQLVFGALLTAGLWLG